VTTRRFLITAAIAATTVALTGCATFTENDVVASVGGAELTEDDVIELADPLMEQLGTDDLELPAQPIREYVANFVVSELLAAELEALGVEAPAGTTEDAIAANTLREHSENLAIAWTSLDPNLLADDLVRTVYEQGADESGVVCAAHILLDDRDEADRILSRLEDGGDFADLAAAYSTGPSGPNGGVLPCLPPADFAAQYIPEFADAALAAEIGVPVGPVESQFGFHIIRLVPSDEMPLEAVVPVRVRTLEDRYDISVDPRYGEWDPVFLIAPVG